MRGSDFKSVREKHGLSQARIAELFEKTQQTIYQWERLERIPAMAEAALRWHTRTLTREDRQAEQSRRDMEHAAQMHRITEDVARERRLSDLERRHPGLFGNGEK